MSVFALNAKQETPTEVEPPKEDMPSTQEEMQSQLQAGAPAIKPTDAKPVEEKQPPKPVEIVLTGPLGHIYTKALNVLLAKEDSISAYNVYDEYERRKEQIEEEEDEGEDKSYVYVASGHDLEQGEVVKAYSDIVKFKNDYPKAKVIVGLESDKGFTRAATSFDRCMTDMGIKTYYKNKSISAAISNLYVG